MSAQKLWIENFVFASSICKPTLFSSLVGARFHQFKPVQKIASEPPCANLSRYAILKFQVPTRLATGIENMESPARLFFQITVSWQGILIICTFHLDIVCLNAGWVDQCVRNVQLHCACVVCRSKKWSAIFLTCYWRLFRVSFCTHCIEKFCPSSLIYTYFLVYSHFSISFLLCECVPHCGSTRFSRITLLPGPGVDWQESLEELPWSGHTGHTRQRNMKSTGEPADKMRFGRFLCTN